MKVRVLLLGANGMLGSMIQKRILLNPNFELIATSRRPSEYEENFDVMKDDITNLIKRVSPEFVINCISLNPQNNARNLFSFYQTFFINSVFPRLLSREAKFKDIKLIQPCTNAVYSGKKGPYAENVPKYPKTIYGFSKLIGEKQNSNQLNLRCSLIGPECEPGSKYLFSWLQHQLPNSEVDGFTNHLWNGITTQIFAKICIFLMTDDNFFSGNLNISTADSVSKNDLLNLIRVAINRLDITINPISSHNPIDLRLYSRSRIKVNQLWRGIGFDQIPKISEIIKIETLI